MLLLGRILTFCLIVRHVCSFKETFNEELVIKPLESGHIYSYFQFTTKWDVDPDEDPTNLHHFNLFPKSVGELVEKFSIQELHVSLTQGLWSHVKWGYPVRSAAQGAEVWAWFKDSVSNVDQNWLDLNAALAGLFCASLNFVDSTNTVQPVLSSRPEGIAEKSYARNSSHVRYASLPREIVCTENLTPWKKLLPCSGYYGLTQLLNARQVFTVHYHSLALDFRPICRTKSCTETALELRLSLSIVSEPGAGSFPPKDDWSLRQMFGSGLFHTCPIAESTTVFVDISSNQRWKKRATGVYFKNFAIVETSPFRLNPPFTKTIISAKGGTTSQFAVYDLAQETEKGPLNIHARYQKSHVYGLVPAPLIQVSRFIAGYGQERGRLVTRLHNNYYSSPINVTYMDIVPWYLRLYMHTLRITNFKGAPVAQRFVHYVPARDRERPHHVEMRLSLPPASVTEISFNFDVTFLKWLEYPPDANHGFHLPAATITAALPVSRNYTGLAQEGTTFFSSLNATQPVYVVRIATETPIVVLPTPDFSMPYNVICLTCTVLALAFGPLHNLTTKRLVVRPKQAPKSVLAKLKALFSKEAKQEKVEKEENVEKDENSFTNEK